MLIMYLIFGNVFNVSQVRVAKILGGGVLDTQVIKGHVLTRDAEGK